MTPATDGYAYFQTSGFSPKLRAVTDEVVRLMEFQARGPALPGVHDRMLQAFEATRASVARTLNATPDEIVLGENATVGINIVANGIDWRPGDNVILSTHEHPGNRIPWYNLARLHGVELRFLAIGSDRSRMLEELRGLIDDRTRVVSVSHVSRRTGIRLPAREIAALAHEGDVPVLFDGAQSFGGIPIDVRDIECDFYTFSGHKYVMAPQGTGGCYIRRDRIEWLRPSWIGSHSQLDFDDVGGLTLLPEAKRFEFGTRDLADQGGFGKALDLWEAVGWQNLFACLADYTGRMKDALLAEPGVILETPVPFDESSGIVTFSLPGHGSVEISDALLRDGVVVSSLEHDTSMIRVSTHVFNTDEDCDRLIQGIRRLRDGGRAPAAERGPATAPAQAR
jgi:selenocysteine lyase/cysteine desulfurase